jgi:hypothetical protein
MLADSISITPQLGRLDQDIHLPSTAKLEIVDFIVEELPRWRDHSDRPPAAAETILTEYLCAYLNRAAYYSSTWSHIQFQPETHDEKSSGRKIDLAVKPRAAALIIEGRRHTLYDALFPIECKRLPTPKEKDRDEREYVTTRFGTTGGMQRFKLGYHGAMHAFAVMIAYVQEQSSSYWLRKINSWIRGEAAKSNSSWNKSDVLQLLSDNLANGVSTLRSEHQREEGFDKCELRHLWIRMK